MRRRTRQGIPALLLLGALGLGSACTAPGSTATTAPAGLPAAPPAAAPASGGSAAAPATPAAAATAAPTAPAAARQVGLQPGNLVPAWSLTTVTGETLSAAQLQAERRPYILFFWATW